MSESINSLAPPAVNQAFFTSNTGKRHLKKNREKSNPHRLFV